MKPVHILSSIALAAALSAGYTVPAQAGLLGGGGALSGGFAGGMTPTVGGAFDVGARGEGSVARPAVRPRIEPLRGQAEETGSAAATRADAAAAKAAARGEAAGQQASSQGRTTPDRAGSAATMLGSGTATRAQDAASPVATPERRSSGLGVTGDASAQREGAPTATAGGTVQVSTQR